MNKLATLLACLLGLSFLFQGAEAASKYCDIKYSWINDCQPLPDDTIEDNCIGSEYFYEVKLGKKQKTYEDGLWLDTISFAGDCKCSLTLYTEADFKGHNFKYSFNHHSKKVKKFDTKKLLKSKAESFKVKCDF